MLGLRVAYGAGLIAAPERLARRWLGPAAGAPPTQVPLRGLGAREIVVHGAAIAAALRGLPLRPFLAASVAGDLADILATAPAAAGCPTAPPRRRSPSPAAPRCSPPASPPPSTAEPPCRSPTTAPERARCSCSCTRSAPTATCGSR